ncbi:MAG TPA: prepilin-type N-terminal cleavage/methylation domain-containing protein [Isosphaeraceae bacterium]|jgi:prepilin-type N-terminal cleavage/methylation domain-containing protein|nr:prepilin-type N-terminal cleavage/methylation domain-containing protein [Isosphaeraceae bacterium]
MTRRYARPRRGFTVLEISIATGLLALLAMLISAVWAGFGRPSAEADRRARLAIEANLAAAALAADLGGGIADESGQRLEGKSSLRFVDWKEPGGTQLWLCFDGGPSPNGQPDWGPPDTVIVYQVEAGMLVRQDQNANTSRSVAADVAGFGAVDLGDGRVQITLTLAFRDLSETFTIIALKPPLPT